MIQFRKNLGWLLLIGLFCIGCETTEGLQEDIEDAGDEVQDTVD